MGSTCDDICDSAGLDLGLGFSSTSNQKSRKQGQAAAIKFDLGLNLSLPGDNQIYDLKTENKRNFPSYNKDQLSAASSYSYTSVKRERDIGSDVTEVERVISSDCYEDDNGSNGRKKLRLTKVQSALLEESFKQQSTLNHKQKQHLARRLNVRPRQVEVWFQNRRARTKLKQTEVDYEFLKKCCATLTDENRKLYKELQELKALKIGQPLYMQLPAAAILNVCPSCERVAAAGTFTNPSAAC
ncbi:homeobox-leucine zipper protein HAT22 [Capsicum chacoense]|uniref:homeobox-leucine zipper protein HAT22 n=1 Tax=Capsicum annuum TaxID=4072 RepID=UPI001FB182A7|nr:homeobox-leucine zipper protein HAT22 [Capsicum annuum]KAF3669013.1 Homeobox-leucine zipper protein HOX27 [Capsicum annuum]KAF3671172.1 Homeobox-leucine zipper protein HOX27 [Capsicum annuum]